MPAVLSPEQGPGRSRLSRLSALACCLVLFGAGAGAQARLYESDEAGFQGKAITGSALEDRAEKGWVLEVETTGSGETRTLRENGIETERTLVERLPAGRRETRVVGGGSKTILEFGRNGALLVETEYAQDGQTLLSRRRYTYAKGMLSHVEAEDPNGASIGRLAYRYDAKGRLVELASTGSFGAETIGALPGTPGPAVLWTATGGSPPGPEMVYVVSYDSSQRPIAIETREDGAVARRESIEYGPRSTVAARRLESPGLKEIISTIYDESGRPASAVATRGGSELRRETWAYDATGRLVAHTTRSPESFLLVTTVYDDVDGSSLETTTRDGVLVLSVKDGGDGVVLKEYYDRGVLYLRATWIKARLAKEDFMLDGIVSRTKVYQ